MKALGIAVSLLTACALVVLSVGLYWYRAPLPDDPPSVVIPELQAPVSVRYDLRRRPFVVADEFTDALVAEGWLHARERLWQMELLRRAAGGRLAEVLGTSMLDTDIEIIRAGVPRLAQSMQANAGSETLTLVAAYVSGINRALRDLRQPIEFRLLGLEPRDWRTDDVFAIGALIAFQSGRNLRNELLRLSLTNALDAPFAVLFNDIPPDPEPREAKVTAGAEFQAYLALSSALEQSRDFFQPPELGSNGWVVAPERSTSGHALFAFDSHDGWSMPNLSYEVHLFFGAGEQVRGFSIPGLPGVINGFNQFMAWGFTNIGDSQDLYLETRNPQHPHQFKGRAGWYEASRESVDIPVAGKQPHRLEILHTENGPLIVDEPPISLRWSAQELGHTLGLDALFRLNRASSLEALMSAVDQFPAPSANLTYADVEGNILFRTVGLLPVRGKGEGLIPLQAQDADSAWLGLLPLSGMPIRLNPSEGYLAAANARVLPEPPLISADNAPGYRMARIESLLKNTPKVSFEDMKRWQGDWHNTQAEWLLPVLLEALEGHTADAPEPAREPLAEALETLGRWSLDPIDAPEARGSLLFEAWYIELARRIFGTRLPGDALDALLANNYVLNHALDRLILTETGSDWWQDRRVALITEALAAVVLDHSKIESGTTWGEQHQVLFRHEMSGAVPFIGTLLDRGPYPWGGGNATLGRARFGYHRPYVATGGATQRLVIEMSEPMRIATVMPGGQSGHPASDHYDDQLPIWLARELEVVASTPEQVGEINTLLTPTLSR